MKPIDPSKRFWEKVEKTDSCWLWKGAINRQGYGNFALSGSRKNPVTISAHRFSFLFHKKILPHGLHLDHLCRVRSCVNPEHLEPVSIGENLRRGEHPNMMAHKNNSCTKGHLLTEENIVKESRSDGSLRLRCRLCAKEREKKRRIIPR